VGGIDVKLCGCVGDEKIRDKMGGLHKYVAGSGY